MNERSMVLAETRLAALMRRANGVAHIRTLLRAGYTRHQVAAMHRSGQLMRPRIGWYCLPDLPMDAIRAIRVGGVLGCVSAAATYRIAVPERADQQLHVSLSDAASRLRLSTDQTQHPPAGSEPDLCLHWHPRLQPVRGFRVAPADAILQMAGCVSNDWLTAAIDSAIRTSAPGRPPILDSASIAAIFGAVPVRARSAFWRSDPSSESVPETFARLGLTAAGISFLTQVQTEAGYRLDFLLDGWLALEIDGAEHHGSPAAFASDRTRDAVLQWYGVRVLRFSYRQVMDDWPFVLETIRRVLREGAPQHAR